MSPPETAIVPASSQARASVPSGALPAHLHSLDLLRGVAAFAVVFWHWRHFFHVGDHVRATFERARQPAYAFFEVFYDRGYEAVPLFFSLSGFVFFWLFAQRIAVGDMPLVRFFQLRLSRLYPLHVATLLTVCAGQAVFRHLHDVNFVFRFTGGPEFVLNLFLMNAIGPDTGMSFNGPAWSISVEMVLYAVFFLYCATQKPRAWSMFMMVLAGFLVLAPFRPTLGRAVGSFFLGGCMFRVYAHHVRRPLPTVLTRALIGVAVLCWGVALSNPTAFRQLEIVPRMRLDSWQFATIVLFPLTILAVVLAEAEAPAACARLARATRLGDMSYSIYLIHFPLQLLVMLCFGRSSPPADVFYSPWTLTGFFAVLALLGVISHDCFEMPMQRMLRARGTSAHTARRTP